MAQETPPRGGTSSKTPPQNPLLDLHTTGGEETVKIDGKEYALTSFDSFSALDQFQWMKQAKRIDKLTDNIEELTDDDAQEIQNFVDENFDKIAGLIPDEIRQQLMPGMKSKIIDAFFLALAAARGIAPELPRTQADSMNGQKQLSQDSSDSMEEPQKVG